MLVPDRCVTLVIRLQGALFLHHQGEESGPGIQVLHGHTVYLLVQELRMAPVLRFSSLPVTNLCLPSGMHNKRRETETTLRYFVNAKAWPAKAFVKSERRCTTCMC